MQNMNFDLVAELEFITEERRLFKISLTGKPIHETLAVVWEILKNDTKWINVVQIVRYFNLKSLKKLDSIN
jgi:hypothetical protein